MSVKTEEPSLRSSLRRDLDVLEAFLRDEENLVRLDLVASLLADRLRGGAKALACGNGGSATQAAHFAEELTGRFRTDRRALPALACAEVGHITCTANDFGFQFIFSRWIEALGRPRDVLLLLSTSGNSTNLVRAVEASRAGGISTVALLGGSGGNLAGACDYEWIVPAASPDRVQEVHMLILHGLIEGVERILFPELWPSYGQGPEGGHLNRPGEKR